MPQNTTPPPNTLLRCVTYQATLGTTVVLTTNQSTVIAFDTGPIFEQDASGTPWEPADAPGSYIVVPDTNPYLAEGVATIAVAKGSIGRVQADIIDVVTGLSYLSSISDYDTTNALQDPTDVHVPVPGYGTIVNGPNMNLTGGQHMGLKITNLGTPTVTVQNGVPFSDSSFGGTVSSLELCEYGTSLVGPELTETQAPVQTTAYVPVGLTSTLVVQTGTAKLIRGGNTFTYTPASPPQPVQQGDQISTPSGSLAHLTIFDGSTTELRSGAAATITTLTASPTRTASLRQTAGTLFHSVELLADPTNRYEVTTPSVSAWVRGTIFSTTIDNHGNLVVNVYDGTVRTQANSVTEDVPAGFTVTLQGGKNPPTPVALSTSDTGLPQWLVSQRLAFNAKADLYYLVHVTLAFLNPSTTDAITAAASLEAESPAVMYAGGNSLGNVTIQPSSDSKGEESLSIFGVVKVPKTATRQPLVYVRPWSVPVSTGQGASELLASTTYKLTKMDTFLIPGP